MTRKSRSRRSLAFVLASTLLTGLTSAGLSAFRVPPTYAAQQTQAVQTTVENGAATEQPSYKSGDFYLEGSRVYVHVGKTGFGHDHAIIGNIKEASLHLGAEQSAGEIVFDMKSFQADTDAARKYIGLEGTTDASTQQQVNANMLGPSVLDVNRFPTATFRINSAKPHSATSSRGLPQYELSGDFTLHGVTRPIRFLADVEMSNGWQHLRGGFTLLQTDYQITPFSKAFGAVGVTNQLSIWGDVWVAP
ncbi:MAG: YceI family protein [Planctomycetales bacterium]|nr:YceI family protein [Planctomycetales bacterium]